LFDGDLTEGKFSLIVIITVVFFLLEDLIVCGILWFLPGTRNDPTHEGTVEIGHDCVAM
jgi:hypothetical protein